MRAKFIESLVGWRAFALGLALASLVLALRREHPIRTAGRARAALVHEARVSPNATGAHLTTHAGARDPSDRSGDPRAPSVAADGAHVHGPEEQSGAPSHPIDAQRDEMQRELQLIGALNDALDGLDTERMRELVEHHRTHHPNDPERMREGYERLIECIEAPGGLSRERALAYYEQARASTLRRYVRRHCLETLGGS